MKETSKKINPRWQNLFDAQPSASLKIWGQAPDSTNSKAIYLEGEEIPAIANETYDCVMLVEGTSLDQAGLQAIIDTHDCDAEQAQDLTDTKDFTKQFSDLEKAIWMSCLDLLRSEGVTSETNAQFRDRVITKYNEITGA